MMALQIVEATRQNASVGVFMENEASPRIPLVFSILHTLFRFAVNVIGVIASAKDFGELAPSRLVPQSFCCASFAVSLAAFARARFRSTYLACDPFDFVRVCVTHLTKPFFSANFTPATSAFRGFALLFAAFTCFPDDLGIRY